MRHKFALGGPNIVTIGDGQNLDAFSRLRVSEAQTLFEAQCQYDAEPTKLEAVNSGDGVAPTHSANNRMVELQVAAGAAGGLSLLQSFQYVHYQPAKSQFVAMTGVMGTGVAGAVKRFGYGDESNGIFFEQSGTNGLYITRRTSVTGVTVDNPVAQASWNIDPLDGTGVSGKTLSPTNCFILIIDLQFLGMGRVRVGFDIDGTIYYAHQFLNAGVLTTPYMQTASLPILAEVRAAAGLAQAATAYFKCAQVASEGGFNEALGRDLTARRGVTLAAGRNLVLAVQPRTTFSTTGIVNRGTFVLESIDILGGTNSIIWELVIGATLAGTTFTDVNAGFSFMQYDTSGTYSAFPAATGIVVLSGYVAGNAASRQSVMSEVSISYPITLNRAGAVRPRGVLALLATPTTGTPDVFASFNWRELR